MAENSQRDKQGIPSIIVVQSDDLSKTLRLIGDPDTFELLVQSSLKGSSGVKADITRLGNFPTEIQDKHGFEVSATPTNELEAIIPSRLVGSNFEGTTIDSNFWTVTNANSGSSAQANNQITLSTNTTANGSTQVQSVRRSRYMGGSSNFFRATISLGDTGVTNNSRKWGIFNGTDGAYFELDGTTLYAVTSKTSTPTRVAQASFNGYTDNIPVLNKANTYGIYVTTRKVYFTINGDLVHTVTADTTTWTDLLSLPAKISNTNSNDLNTNQTISCRAMSIYRLGNLSSQTTSKYQSGTTAGLVLKYGPGNLHGIAVSGVNNNSVITLYDNTAASGTVIWSSGTMPAITQPFDIELHDIPFGNGLTLAITGANSIVTVSYE